MVNYYLKQTINKPVLVIYIPEPGYGAEAVTPLRSAGFPKALGVKAKDRN